MSDRTETLRHWLRRHFDGVLPRMQPASADASFRRYWRIDTGGATLIAVDAPPDTEDNAAFVRLARALADRDLIVPRIFAQDLAQGFLLLEDLGNRHYLDELTEDNAERFYKDAIAALVRLQAAEPIAGLPDYDEPFLRRELGLFEQWLLNGLLELDLDDRDRSMLEGSGDILIASALAQPRVCVHRDYHSRNLMLTDRGCPGILDFQDAVLGPISYDLVSLLRDCYIAWPDDLVQSLTAHYLELAGEAGLLDEAQIQQFPGWFDLMGIQRHLKAAGIFARLALRDGRPAYLGDLPRTLAYVRDVAARHAALKPLAQFVGERVLPELESRSDLPSGTAPIDQSHPASAHSPDCPAPHS